MQVESPVGVHVGDRIIPSNNSWWNKNGDAVITTSVFLGGCVLIIGAAVSEGLSFGLATPAAASLTVMGISMLSIDN